MSTLDYSGYALPSTEEEVTQEITTGLDYSNYVRPDKPAETLSVTPPSKYTYDSIKSNDGLRRTAVRFAKNRIGHKTIDEDEAIDEFIEHFRQMSVNEVYAGMDFNYVSGLVTDSKSSLEKKQELEDYKTLYTAFEKMPSFFESGGSDSLTALLDYTSGIATAPSTYLSLLIPAGGKVAGQAAVATSKLAIGRLLTEGVFKQGSRGFLGTGLRANKNLIGSVVDNPLKSTAVVEGIGGSLQDIGEQNVRQELDIQDGYDFGRTALAAAVSAGTSVGVPLTFLRKKVVKRIESDTGELKRETGEAILKRKEEATKNADKTIEENSELANSVTQKLNALNREMYDAGKKRLGEMADGAELNESIRVAVSPEKFKQVTGALTEILKNIGGLEPNERIMDGLARAVRELKRGDTPGSQKATKDLQESFGSLIRKYNLTYDDIGNIFIADVSDAARTMQIAGQSKKDFMASLKKFDASLNDVANFDVFGFSIELKELSAELSENIRKGDVRGALSSAGGKTTLDKIMEKTMGEKAYDSARRADAARLAFMTSQTATTVRNTLSGVSRVGIDLATRSLDNALAKATGTNKLTPNSDEWAVIYGLMNKKEAGLVEEVFELGFQDKASHLFRQLADIGDATGINQANKVGRLEKVARELNALNTISDNMFKRAAFVGNLKRGLNDLYTQSVKDSQDFIKEFGSDAYLKKFKRPVEASDFDLKEILRTGRFNDVFGTAEGKQALDKIIEDTLYFTFQKTPDSKFARTAISTIHSMPFAATSVFPFPRFMFNAMRFTYEYSPVYLAANSGARGQLFNASKGIANKLTNKEIFSVDDTITSYEDAAKGLIGLGALAAATAFRMSEHAGENWYDYKTESGKTFSMLPLFPAPPYLFFGDMLARYIKGEPIFKNQDTFVSAIQALTGAQFKAGLGLYALEGAIQDITDPDLSVEEKFGKFGGEFVGNLLSTITIPVTALQDLDNTFLAPDDERLVKEGQKDFFSLIVDKTLQRIPRSYMLEKKLEEVLGDSLGYKAPTIRQEATKEGVRRREAPITRQTAGLLLNEKKNAFEAELDRLKIRKYTLFPRTTNVEYNEMYGGLMDEFVANYFVPFVKGKYYNDLEDADLVVDGRVVSLTKAERQADALKAYVSAIKDKYINPGLKNHRTRVNMLQKYPHYPKDVLDFERLPKNVRQLAKHAYVKMHGSPSKDNDYDYFKLLRIGRKIDANYPLNFEILEGGN